KAHGLADKKTLVVIDSKSPANENLRRSANNLPQVKTLLAHYLNVRDLLVYDHIVMPKAAVEVVESYLGERSRTAAPAQEE
ncbi:MAG: 50S ribosomal protein L4, partial [Chloroflexus sp.]|nr:50S ribosomal protein L4 [Chloroflexus sp.]